MNEKFVSYSINYAILSGLLCFSIFCADKTVEKLGIDIEQSKIEKKMVVPEPEKQNIPAGICFGLAVLVSTRLAASRVIRFHEGFKEIMRGG